MKLYMIFAAIALLMSCAVLGDDGIRSETFRLQYVAPEKVIEVLKKRQGIEQLTLNYTENSVSARGDEKAMRKFKADLQALDIQPTFYWVKMRLSRFNMDARGRQTETVVMSPSTSTIDNAPVSFSQLQDESGFSVFVTVSQNTDKSMTLSSEVRELGNEGEIMSSGKNIRKVTLGELARTVGMTDSKDKEIRKAVHHGVIVKNSGEYNGYYLDVKIEMRSTPGK